MRGRSGTAGTSRRARATAFIVRVSPLLTLPLLVAGCEFFHSTTVPVSDTSAPWAVVSLHYDGDHQQIYPGNESLVQASTSSEFEHATSNPWKSFIALAAGVDGGGVAQVQMHSRITAQCVYGPIDLHVLEPWTQQTVTQAGSPGDTVDDGLFAFKGFRGGDWLSHLTFCSDGSYKVSLAWYAVARDFHGNVAHKGLGRVSYVKWGS